MDIVEWESNINLNWFWGVDYEINAYTNWESLLTMKATKKGWNYNISIEITNSLKLEWTITPKISAWKIDVKYNATLTIKSEYEEWDDTIVPLKGNWAYYSISDFDVIAPENAQDLTEILWAYLWWMLWWNNEELDYENNWGEEEFYVEEMENAEILE